MVPTSIFEKTAISMLGNTKYEAFITKIASDPLMGVLIEGTGGLRKVRVARPGGGTRVIYYFHNENKPIFLVAIYAKSAPDNLTDSQKNIFKKLVDVLKKY